MKFFKSYTFTYAVMVLSFIFFLLLLATLLTSFLFPVYPDEIAARLTLSRLFYDFPDKASTMPTCISAFTQRWPVSWLFPGLINFLLFGFIQNPIEERVMGGVIGLLFIGILFFYIRKRVFQYDTIKYNCKLPYYENANYFLLVLIVSIMSVGVYPLFLVLTKQEELVPISLMILILLLIYIRDVENNLSFFKKIIISFFYFSSVSIIIFSHPKGEILIPFSLIIGIFIFSKFKSFSFIFLFFIVFSFQVKQGYSAWAHSLQCPEVPGLNDLTKGFYIDPFSLYYDPHYFFTTVGESFKAFPVYLLQIGFRSSTDINYLPHNTLGFFEEIANFFIHLNVALFFILTPFLLVYFYYRYDYKNKKIISINFILLVLYFSLVITGIFNLSKNWYDAGYLYSILLVVLIVMIGENLEKINFCKVFTCFFIYILPVTILSQGSFVHRLLPEFLRGYSGPSISMINYIKNRKLINQSIKDVARRAHISSVNGKRIIVDDLTYFYFNKTYIPMPITYIFLKNKKDSIHSFILNSNSSGLIVRCSYMPKPYFSLAVREGNICAIPREKLKNLPVTNW